MPPGTAEVGFLSIDAGIGAPVHRVAVDAPGLVHSGELAIAWNGSAALGPGQYLLQALPSGEVANVPVYLHAGYELVAVHTQPASGRFSLSGLQTIVLEGSRCYKTNLITLRFTLQRGGGTAVFEDVPGEIDRESGHITALTPAFAPPEDWYDGCADMGRPVRSASCVPDLPVAVALSLDGGTTFSNALNVTFGHTPKLRIAFLYVGPRSDNGWTFAHNLGRLDLEREFGGLVNVSTYVENVPDGEYEARQPNRGYTLVTGTEVPEYFPNSTAPNLYHRGFWQLRRWCDEDYDLVFTTSFAFRAQTFDVSSGYAPCRLAADNVTPHVTHFVHATGDVTNNQTSTMVRVCARHSALSTKPWMARQH